MHPMGSRACGHDLCRIFGSAAFRQCVAGGCCTTNPFQKPARILGLAAFLPIASAPWHCLQMQSGAELRSFSKECDVH